MLFVIINYYFSNPYFALTCNTQFDRYFAKIKIEIKNKKQMLTKKVHTLKSNMKRMTLKLLQALSKPLINLSN